MAKAAMKTNEASTDDAAARDALRLRRDDLKEKLAAAATRAATPWDRQVPETRALREAREEVLELQPLVAQAERALAAAEAAERARVVAARRPGLLERARRLRDSFEVACTDADELQAYGVETARLIGLADEQAELHPTPDLLGVRARDGLARLRRLVDPTPSVTSEPVPAGRVRLRLSARVSDRERCGQMFLPGDQADFEIGVAKDLVKRGLAVEVTA